MNTSEMSDTAQDLKDQAQDTMRQWQERAKEKARNASVAADQYVRENVWTSVAFAAVAGCVVGYLLGRSRED